MIGETAQPEEPYFETADDPDRYVHRQGVGRQPGSRLSAEGVARRQPDASHRGGEQFVGNGVFCPFG